MRRIARCANGGAFEGYGTARGVQERFDMNITESIQTLERLIATGDPAMKRRRQVEILAYYQVLHGLDPMTTGLQFTAQEQGWYDEARHEAALKLDVEGR